MYNAVLVPGHFGCSLSTDDAHLPLPHDYTEDHKISPCPRSWLTSQY